jgi:hypothetical protein
LFVDKPLTPYSLLWLLESLAEKIEYDGGLKRQGWKIDSECREEQEYS